MMTHEEIRHKLSEYIDSAVDPEEQAEIETHLESCDECAGAVRELKKTIEHIRHIESVEPPAWMVQKIMAGVREQAKGKKDLFHRLFFPLRIKLPLEALGVLFLAVTAFYMFRGINQTGDLPQQPGSMGTRKEEISPLLKKDSSRRPEAVPQSPEYKALDMKPGYGNPPPPVVRKKEAPPAAPLSDSRAAEPLHGQRKETAGPRAVDRMEDRSVMRPPEEGLAERKGVASGDLRNMEKAGRAPSAAARMPQSAGEREIQNVTVIAGNVDEATREIEKALLEVSAGTIKTEPLEDKKIVTAEVRSTRIKDFLEKLKHAGIVKENALTPALREESILLRIEVVKK